jgi:hypothetical protein
MMSAALGTLFAGLLVLGFALAGEALIGRSSRDLFGWNESFLIGLGACAAALFPFSLIAPRGALHAELGIIALSSIAVALRRLTRRAGSRSTDTSGEFRAIATDGIAISLLTSIILLALFFGVLNLWHGLWWDGVQVWGTRAKLLFVEGGLSRRWFPEDPYDSRLLSYPPLISFFEALFSRVRGSFDFDALKPIFFPFFLSMLLSTYAAARTLCSPRWALAATLLVALLPELTTREAAGGYVDMPLAAFVAAVVAACLRTDSSGCGWRSPLPWLIGAMTTVKQEGVILALIACGGIFVYWLAERPLRLAKRIRSEWTGAIVVLAFVAARVGYVRWIGVHDITWGPFDAEHRARAVKNLGLVASLCLRLLLDPKTWGLFWPAFFLASVLIVAYGLERPAHLAIATAATVVVYAAIFLLTNWPIEQHIEGAYSRLLAQLAPAAAVVIGAAGQRIWSERLGEAA